MDIRTEPLKVPEAKPIPRQGTDPELTTENPAGFANEAEPTWAPPESQPEPRPVEPILNQD